MTDGKSTDPPNADHPDADDYALKSTVPTTPIDLPRLSYQPARPKKYRPHIGLIGCGGITVEHLRAYKNAGYHVSALADIKVDLAEKRRDEFELDAEVYSDAMELLARGDIDVVDLATHPSDRERLLSAAIAADKHVLSQKPFVLDLDFGRQICDEADRRGLKLAVNQNGRWAPYVSWIRHAIADGLIGDVESVDMLMSWDHTWVQGTKFETIPHLILYDFAVHWFDMLHCYTRGQVPQTVFAQVCRAPGQSVRPPLLAQISVQLDKSQASMVFRGGSAQGSMNFNHITGSAGTISSVGAQLEEDQTITVSTPQGQGTPEIEGSWFPGGFDGTMSELICAIEEDRQPTNSGRDNLETLAMVMAAMQSAESGQPVRVGSVTRVESSWVEEA